MKNNKKSLSLILTSVLMFSVILAFVPLSSASYVCPVAQTAVCDLTSSSIVGEHPSADSDVSSLGVAFTANASAYLYNVTWWCYRPVADWVTITAKLYTIQAGTVGTNAYPSNTVLATSDAVNSSIFSGSSAWQTWTFDGTYQIESGESYVIAFEMTEKSGSGFIRYYSESVSASFNSVTYKSSNWYASTIDVMFIINGDTESYSPTPTPTPTPTPGGGGTPIGTATLVVDAYADCNVSWNVQGSAETFYEGVFNLPVGTVIEMLCTPDDGYYFDYWWATFDEGSTFIEVNPLHFTLYWDLGLTGYVDAAPQDYQTLTLQEGAGGQVYVDYAPENWTGTIRFFSGVYSIATNTSITIGGLPSTNYQFYRTTLAWNIGGVSLSSTEYDNPITVSLIGSLTAKVYFTAGSLFPTPSGGATDGGSLGYVLTLLTSEIMIALFIMIIVGAVCFFMAGPWGFFVGINVAAIMLLLAGVIEAWAIIVLVILDALLLYGRVSTSKNDKKGE